MEKEFVPYTESLELKELGFDEPCLALYYNTYTSPKIRMVPQTKEGKIDYINLGLCDERQIPVPLYSQAFRWFRENYGLWQIVQQNTDKDWTYDIMPIIGMINYKLFDVFETYEEAELACLKKLIEIVKEKNL